MHPEADGYELKLWGEDDIIELDFLTNRDIILNKDLNPALRADYLRIEFLHKFGGLYADVDMVCERNVFTALAEAFDLQNVDFITGVSNTQAFEINNGIILAKPGSPFAHNLV